MGRGTRNTPWQLRTTWDRLGTDFSGYRDWIMQQEVSDLSKASETTGVPESKIRDAARMLTAPIDGRRPKTSFALEKGNYWSNNYLNTTSYAALALICGTGNRPGQVRRALEATSAAGSAVHDTPGTSRPTNFRADAGRR